MPYLYILWLLLCIFTYKLNKLKHHSCWWINELSQQQRRSRILKNWEPFVDGTWYNWSNTINCSVTFYHMYFFSPFCLSCPLFFFLSHFPFFPSQSSKLLFSNYEIESISHLWNQFSRSYCIEYFWLRNSCFSLGLPGVMIHISSWGATSVSITCLCLQVLEYKKLKDVV